MKKAFTLIEIIFVIAIIAILAGIGVSSMKIDHLHKDGEFVLIKIKQAHLNALGFDGNNEKGCIKLTKDAINDLQKTQKDQNPYIIKSNIKAKTLQNDILCFDSQGRPHNGASYQNNVLITNNIIKGFTDIKLTYNKKNCTIRVYPLSGYGIILCP